jgi:phage terminase large subunit
MSPEAENGDNLPPGYYERMSAGKDAEWIDEYVHGKNPRADKGSIYGELLADLKQRGGILDFTHPRDGVHLALDLGISDSTAIWWWRLNEHGMPDLIDWYEASGKGASHYFEVIRSRPWVFQKIWLPHDARSRSFQTGVNTIQLFEKEFGPGMVLIGPELSPEEGIGASRWLLEQPMRIHETRCAEGLKRLRAYRYTWDEEKKVFSKKPLHDWTSHTADAFRYLALVAQRVWQLTRPEPKKPKPAISSAVTLTQLFDEADTGFGSGRL